MNINFIHFIFQIIHHFSGLCQAWFSAVPFNSMSYQLQKSPSLREKFSLITDSPPFSPQIFILCLCRRRMGRVLSYISGGNHEAFWGRLRHRIHSNLPPSDLSLTGFNEVIGSASACKTSLWMHSAVALRKSHLQPQVWLYKLSLCSPHYGCGGQAVW